MAKRFLVLMFALIFITGFSGGAAAEYFDPPGWESNPYFTHQSWDFDAVNYKSLNCPPEKGDPPPVYPTIPLAPDGRDDTWHNPYGTPHLTDFNSFPDTGGTVDWMWVPHGIPWERCGCYGGMDSTYVQFEIPNTENSDLLKEMWLQYVVGIHKDVGDPNDRLETLVWTDGDEGAMIEREYESLGPCGSNNIKFWRVTELWEIDPQPGVEYVKLMAEKLWNETAVAFDTVTIETRCVPIPGTVLLLGSGLLGLLGIRRKKKLTS